MYNILYHTNTLNFDENFDILEQNQHLVKKDFFSPKEKILIEFFDTDYFDPDILNHGLILYNIFTIAKIVDIPLHVFIFVTNHFGIQKDINSILKDHHINDRPIVIETFLRQQVYNSNVVQDFQISAKDIKFPAVSMMGANRSHRHALFNWMKTNNLLDRIKVTIRRPKQ